MGTNRSIHRVAAAIVALVFVAVAQVTASDALAPPERAGAVTASGQRWIDYVDPPAPIGSGVWARYPASWAEPAGRSNLNTRLSNDMVTLASYPIRASGATCGSLPANALADLPNDGALVVVIEAHLQDEPPRPQWLVPFDASQTFAFPVPCNLDTVNGDTWLTKFNDHGRNIYVFAALGPQATTKTSRAVARVVNSLQFTPSTVPVVREHLSGVLTDGRTWTVRQEFGRGLCAVLDGVDHGCETDHPSDAHTPIRVVTDTNGGVLAYANLFAGLTDVVAQYPDGTTTADGVVVSRSGNFWALPLDPATNPVGYSYQGATAALPATVVTVP